MDARPGSGPYIRVLHNDRPCFLTTKQTPDGRTVYLADNRYIRRELYDEAIQTGVLRDQRIAERFPPGLPSCRLNDNGKWMYFIGTTRVERSVMCDAVSTYREYLKTTPGGVRICVSVNGKITFRRGKTCIGLIEYLRVRVCAFQEGSPFVLGKNTYTLITEPFVYTLNGQRVSRDIFVASLVHDLGDMANAPQTDEGRPATVSLNPATVSLNPASDSLDSIDPTEHMEE